MRKNVIDSFSVINEMDCVAEVNGVHIQVIAQVSGDLIHITLLKVSLPDFFESL